MKMKQTTFQVTIDKQCDSKVFSVSGDMYKFDYANEVIPGSAVDAEEGMERI